MVLWQQRDWQVASASLFKKNKSFAGAAFVQRLSAYFTSWRHADGSMRSFALQSPADARSCQECCFSISANHSWSIH